MRKSSQKPRGEAKSQPDGHTGRSRRTPDGIPDLHAFTVTLFRHYGATVTPVNKREKHGALHVRLPEALVEHFGAGELSLAFQSVEEGSGQQLVAHGSRIFDRMLALLRQEGALTMRRLPARHTGSDGLLRAVHPRNAGVSSLKLQERQEPLFVFTWRLTYRADDKREELHTVVLNAAGERVVLGEAGGLADLDTLLAESAALTDEERAAADEFEDESAAPAGGHVDGAKSSPARPGEPGIKLPAMALLVRLAERARKLAVYHADVRCAAHEGEVLPRLYKVVDRLTNYYAQQAEELAESTDPLGERRTVLAADLARKIAEEVENHRLRVQVDLCTCAILWLPVAQAEMTLRRGALEASLTVQLDRHMGIMHRPACYACGSEMEGVVLDRNGHLHCDACLRQCESCHEIVCKRCGVEPCPVCGKVNCSTCGRECWACGRRACADHVSRCPVCGDEVCHDCQQPCDECGVLQCRSHLRADAVRGPDGSTRLVCATCAIRCPGCSQYSARLGVCSLSGQRFCNNCLVTCSQCGRTVGPGYYAIEAGSGMPVCRSCVKICASCGKAASETDVCAECGAECCAACEGVCAVCNRTMCSDHHGVAAGCGHVLCSEHMQMCAIGGETVCPKCNQPCAICERPVCSHHQRPCPWCGQIYCSECMDARYGMCGTCSEAFHSNQTIDILAEPAGKRADIQLLAPRYEWRKASNRAVTVYVGANQSGAVFVSVRTARDGNLVVVTRQASLSRL